MRFCLFKASRVPVIKVIPYPKIESTLLPSKQPDVLLMALWMHVPEPCWCNVDY